MSPKNVRSAITSSAITESLKTFMAAMEALHEVGRK